MDMQINVLKQLRTSECEKRNETIIECQKIKKNLEILDVENNKLVEENLKLKRSLETSHRDLKASKTELKMMADQMMKIEELLKKKRETNRIMEDKITQQQKDICCQTKMVHELKESLKITQNNLHNTESDFKNYQKAYEELSLNLKEEVKNNCNLTTEICTLNEYKNYAERTIEKLQYEVEKYVSLFEDFKNENAGLKNDVTNVTLALEEEKRKTWVKNTKEFALLSLSALQKIAYIMLPAYIDDIP